jgi:hypothetical protein
MSMYRHSDKVPMSDIYAEKVKKADQPWPVAPAATPVDANKPKDAQQHRRKGEPVNVVLPRTREWAESLPREVRLPALLRAYPRIANMIAAAWTDSAATSTYLDDLLIDRRGRRQGFPVDVLDELILLRTYYAALHPESPIAWKQTDRRD